MSQLITAITNQFEQFLVLFWPHIQMCVFKPQWYIGTVGGWQKYGNRATVTITIVNIFRKHQLIDVASYSTMISARCC